MQTERSGAFTDNMRLPVHRWFRYSAGFSAQWAESVLRSSGGNEEDIVFDPFAGCGTTLLAAQRCNRPNVGSENHPFVARIARAKLCWSADERHLFDAGARLLSSAIAQVETIRDQPPQLLVDCYTPEVLRRLDALKSVLIEQPESDPAIANLLWLVITALLRKCSGVGTAQWQYVLPKRSKVRVTDPFKGFQETLEMFCLDMCELKKVGSSFNSDLRLDDSRTLQSFGALKGKVGQVLTSPPYPNNYDYADATRLEMTFWGEVSSWRDLQGAVRHRLVRSCSQHSAAEKLELADLLKEPGISSIREDLTDVCSELSRVRETRAGRKTYHTMIAAYFGDLAKTFNALRPLCKPGASLCFVIGDSAPYGVHVPVESWLTRLAVASGFTYSGFEKVRDRNLKWKNRKHRVPLLEGNLWLRS